MVVKDFTVQGQGESNSRGSAKWLYLNDRELVTIVRRSRRLTIHNTGVPVSTIVSYRKLGYSIDRIVRAMPHLKKPQVEYALALYQQNENIRKEVDAEIAAERA